MVRRKGERGGSRALLEQHGTEEGSEGWLPGLAGTAWYGGRERGVAPGPCWNSMVRRKGVRGGFRALLEQRGTEEGREGWLPGLAGTAWYGGRE